MFVNCTNVFPLLTELGVSAEHWRCLLLCCGAGD
jgi:hypothetical protein